MRRSTAAGLSAADLARAARSSWAFFESAAALRRSAKLVFLDLFISTYASRHETAPGPFRLVQIGAHPAIFQGHEKAKIGRLRLVETPRFEGHRLFERAVSTTVKILLRLAAFPVVRCSTRLCRKRSQDRQDLLAERLAQNHYGNINPDVIRRDARGLAEIFDRDTGRRLEDPAPLS
jgi:hypothetical protein